MSVEDSDKLAGTYLTREHCVKLFEEDVDLYDKESGKCLAKFRKNIIPADVQLAAYDNLLKAAAVTDARVTGGGGEVEEGKPLFKFRVRKDGTTSKQVTGKKVASGIVGYWDRTPRFPYCRLTAFNMHQFDKFKLAYPMIKFVDNMYAKLMPQEFKKQMAAVNKTNPDFVIKGTSFSTVTVNKNYMTAVHKDAGDFKDGFGNLVAMRKGTFTGCYFTLPRWGCGFDLRNGDLLLVDVHQWHGNTPIHFDDKKAVRLSLVMYFREHMVKCGSLAQELQRVKTRKKGDKLR